MNEFIDKVKALVSYLARRFLLGNYLNTALSFLLISLAVSLQKIFFLKFEQQTPLVSACIILLGRSLILSSPLTEEMNTLSQYHLNKSSFLKLFPSLIGLEVFILLDQLLHLAILHVVLLLGGVSSQLCVPLLCMQIAASYLIWTSNVKIAAEKGNKYLSVFCYSSVMVFLYRVVARALKFTVIKKYQITLHLDPMAYSVYTGEFIKAFYHHYLFTCLCVKVIGYVVMSLLVILKKQ